MARVVTKIGDVFSVNLDENTKKYFQLIAFDLTQLNSDVIRAFGKTYSINDNPELSDIINDDIDFYAHCVTKLGVKLGLWNQVGNLKTVGDIKDILFRDTNDYGMKVNGKPLGFSDKWYIWRIGDRDFTRVGKLTGVNRKAEIGIVINPLGIIEKMKGNKYPINYPDFE